MPLRASLGLVDDETKKHQAHYGLQLTEATHKAYRAAAQRQQAVQQKNKDRRDANCMRADGVCPPGSLALFWEPEKTLKPIRDANGEKEKVKKPKKLEFRFTGPFRVHRSCDCKQHRWILHTGRKKLVKVNVNRLRAFSPWDEAHIYTNTREEMERLEQDHYAEEEVDAASFDNHHKQEGSLVIVNTAGGDVPFWVGLLIKRRSDHPLGHLVQWFHNRLGKTLGSKKPGWVEATKAKRHSYREARLKLNDTMFTNESDSTPVHDYNIVPLPPFELTKKHEIPHWVLQTLSDSKDIDWTLQEQKQQ